MTYKALEQERISSLETKNTKIKNLLNKSKPNMQNNYEVPVINLTNTNITTKEMSHLKNGLHHSFAQETHTLCVFDRLPVVSLRRAKYKQMYGLNSTLTVSR